MRQAIRGSAAIALLIAPGLLLASSSPAPPASDPLRASIARAIDEARSAERRSGELERQAREAEDEAVRLQAEQLAAAEAIAASEAGISAADARVRLAARLLEARRQRLRAQQAPAGSLLAGLAMMADRPPLLALVDDRSIEEFVRIRLLLESTLPEIHRRTAALRSQIEQGRALEGAARAALADARKGREQLEQRKRRFAELERRAAELAEQRTGEALSSGDLALARNEEAEQLIRQQQRSQSSRTIAASLAALPPPPPRPGTVQGSGVAPFPYRLPAQAPVSEGFETVAANGIRSRGVRLGTARGTSLVAPADGIVRFSGPFRGYDGVVILDHGDGWTSLLVDVSSPLKERSRVRIGDPIGRALGPIEVELSRNGKRVSPALIAGSSQTLSNGGKAE